MSTVSPGPAASQTRRAFDELRDALRARRLTSDQAAALLSLLAALDTVDQLLTMAEDGGRPYPYRFGVVENAVNVYRREVAHLAALPPATAEPAAEPPAGVSPVARLADRLPCA